MVVLGTVLLNATTARLFSKLVGVFLERSNAIMIVGASDLARMIAKYLKENKRRVVLIDSNIENVEKAKEEGLESIEVNIYDDELTDNIELNDVGYLIAMTGSDSINKFVISNFSSIFGEQGAYRLATSQEVITKDYEDEDHLFTIEDDYINLMEAVREFPEIHETVVNSIDDYKNKIKEINRDQKSIPIFVKSQKNEILLISEFEKNVKKIEDWKLVYVGKNLNI
ncbi:hypothetical protein CSC82_26750 [Rhodobacteraceae bacterium 4F10]|nr:hypothetical protein CSC82_26750 [Rhodobacteraceae bacterium 4F10]